MIRAPCSTRHERSRLFRITAAVALLAQVVAIGLSPLAEARELPDVPTHIEAADRPHHAGHHPADCAFCTVRHLSPLVVSPVTGERPGLVRQVLRPVSPHQTFIASYRDPDPARAPPHL